MQPPPSPPPPARSLITTSTERCQKKVKALRAVLATAGNARWREWAAAPVVQPGVLTSWLRPSEAKIGRLVYLIDIGADKLEVGV